MSSGSGARDTLQEQPGRRSDHEREPGQTTIQTADRVGRLRRVAYDDGQTERRFLVSIRARSKPLSASAGKMWPWETVCWSIRRARCGKRFRCSGGEGWKEKPDGFYRIPQGFCRAAAVTMTQSPAFSRGHDCGDGRRDDATRGLAFRLFWQLREGCRFVRFVGWLRQSHGDAPVRRMATR